MFLCAGTYIYAYRKLWFSRIDAIDEFCLTLFIPMD